MRFVIDFSIENFRFGKFDSNRSPRRAGLKNPARFHAFWLLRRWSPRPVQVDFAKGERKFSIYENSAADMLAPPPVRPGAEHGRDADVYPQADGAEPRSGVRTMTGWPAARMGPGDRRLIRAGARADLVLFDMGRPHDRATWDAPICPPEGIDEVRGNGVLAIDDGRPTAAKAGQALRDACEVG